MEDKSYNLFAHFSHSGIQPEKKKIQGLYTVVQFILIPRGQEEPVEIHHGRRHETNTHYMIGQNL